MLIQQLANGIVLGSTYGLMAIGLTILFGILNIINLAHGEIYMLGAFVAYFLVVLWGVNFFFALVVATLAMGLVGVVAERLVFRPLRDKDEINYFIVSVGLLTFLENLGLLFWGPEPRSMALPQASQTIRIGEVIITVQRLYTVLIAVGVIIGLHFFIKHSRMGKAMRAMEQDREAALTVGVEIDEVSSFTFFLGSALAGTAGALMGSLFIVNPVMGFGPLLKAFVIVIFGGLGSVLGAIVGGLILGMTEVLASSYISSAYQDAFAFLILILVLSFKPTGLFGKR
ncbi:MAG TPA: branched-chain amino acid ABC transporter permease [Thermodesulfobacteriota bacterium]|nr:branched-chain amino acid ABC transporter permease [Thermodesulfobacteriota bacterium]